jgi:hypothetical protein
MFILLGNKLSQNDKNMLTGVILFGWIGAIGIDFAEDRCDAR